MNKKLNICAFALALLLIVSLGGCGGASDKEEPAGMPEQTAAETPEQTAVTPEPSLPESTTPPEESVDEPQRLLCSL